MRIMRAHEFACTIGADTKEDLVAELYNLARRLERDDIDRGCMGGSVAGSIYAYRHDPTITHEGYFDLIKRHIEQNRMPTTGVDHS
jgi:hypothetical protein